MMREHDALIGSCIEYNRGSGYNFRDMFDIRRATRKGDKTEGVSRPPRNG